jgi:hypothetical protein
LGPSSDDDGDGDPIADPITDARNRRDQAIDEILVATLDSDLYDAVFIEALRITQAQVVRSAELEDTDLLRDKGPVSFDMRGLYPSIYERLRADELTAFITEEAVPAEFGIFPVADRDTTINAVWAGVRSGPGWRTATYAGAVFALIGSIVVAERRPSRAIQFGFGMAGTATVIGVFIFIIRAVVPILAGGGASGGPVVAVYAANIWPLFKMMIWVLALGLILAFGGWIARLIWPDDWVYSHVSDDRGVRSIMRRRGAPEPTQQVAAATPVQYPGYAQPYQPYPPGWAPQPYPGQPYPGQPYPGQQYPPAGSYQYPVGPYAQPALTPVPPFTPGRPTVPVLPVDVETGRTPAVTDADTGATPRVTPNAEAAPATVAEPPADTPPDAAQAAPKVVAEKVVPEKVVPEKPVADEQPTTSKPPVADDWSAEPEW